MAVVPICYKMHYKDPTLSIKNVSRLSEGGFACDYIAGSEGSMYLASSCTDRCRRWHALFHGPTTDMLSKSKRKGVNASKRAVDDRVSLHLLFSSELPVEHRTLNKATHTRSTSENSSQRGTLGTACYASESSTMEKQLRSLHSYFGKLQDDVDQPSSMSCQKMSDLADRSSQILTKERLESLNAYLDKLQEDTKMENYATSAFEDQTTEGNPSATQFSVSQDSKRGDETQLKSFVKLRSKDVESRSGRSTLQQYNETSDLYLISILASINIAVFLFEVASPVRNSDFNLFSLPLLYGAKINDLILVGEWWRLVTPMFLHSGVFHIALGCWSLLTFGPQVCRVYGSFTFFLIYILGGISGNLTSFLHTPGPTVGGTGPVFAIIGAWLIYQMQNKDVIAKDVSESLFQKAVFTTALCFILSHFGPIDDWTHLGAIFTGILYGFFTCSTLQLDDTSSRAGQEEGITLARRYANSCKSLIVFTTCLGVLSSLLFFIEPPLETLELEDFF
ncbi:Rhomboid domain-containing protein [Cephalotus follicularis]|uniref:Rhomboid domain-containing protein n=1 Tax=Cephalotus follicularis TaxID=3775 RepID=A0A1Q3C608_CEPFO|nr:Rhomboid domain-containing protein [Cephalotus follicularis]